MSGGAIIATTLRSTAQEGGENDQAVKMDRSVSIRHSGISAMLPDMPLNCALNRDVDEWNAEAINRADER